MNRGQRPLSISLHDLPVERRDHLRDIFRQLFRRDPPTSLVALPGGVSGALVGGFTVRDRRYVLRVEPDRVERIHRDRAYACMANAAAVGVAPAVLYADAAQGVAIMDFIHAQPLAVHSGGPRGLAEDLGALLSKLQATSPFPAVGDLSSSLTAALAQLRSRLALETPDLSSCTDRLARIAEALTQAPLAAVSSHNDPNPRNLIFDGARVWLVDWELASLGDPLMDVAILTTETTPGRELEDILLRAVMHAPPTRQLRARLFLVRLLTHLFYGCVVLDSLGETAAGLVAAQPALNFAQFHQALQDGRLASGAPQTACAFALMSLKTFHDAGEGGEFDAAMRAVRSG